MQNLYVFSLYHNPDLDHQMFYCLLTSLAAVKADYVRASFLCVGELNGSGFVLRPLNVIVLQP